MTQMIKTTLKLALLLVASSLQAQPTEWYEFEMDGALAEFPTEDVQVMDTTLGSIRTKQMYTEYNQAAMLLQVLPAQQSLITTGLSSLPETEEEVSEFYDGIIRGVEKASGAKVSSKKPSTLGNLKGYEVIYSKDGQDYMDSRFFLAGDNVVMANIFNSGVLEDDVRKHFLASMEIEGLDLELVETAQGEEVSSARRLGRKVGKWVFRILILGLVYFLVNRFRNRKKVE